MRRLGIARGWLADLRSGFRSALRNPMLSALAVLLVALGVAAPTLLYGVVDGVLLEPLPYADDERLVVIRNRQVEDGQIAGASWRELADWREGAGELFASVGASIDRPYNVAGTTEPVQVWASQVSRDYLRTLGTPAFRGRVFTESELAPGGARAMLVSHGFWQRWLGGDEEAVGRRLLLDDEPYEVVGVMPPLFRSPGEPVELWVPFEARVDRPPADYGLKFFTVVARLAPGVALPEAEQAMAAVGRRIAEREPRTNANLEVVLIPMRRQIAGAVRGPLLVLLAAAGFVLLLACFNVANLLLARTAARRRELAVRRALGAGTAGLLRQLLCEGLVLSIAGGVAGLLVALLALGALPRLLPAGVLPLGTAVSVDAGVVAFAAALVAGTAALFALVPLVALRREEGAAALRGGVRGGGRGGLGRWLRSGLTAAQVGVALVLLVAATLLVGAVQRLDAVDPGFEPRGVLSFYLLLPDSRYEDVERRQAFLDGLLGRLDALPAVSAAGVVTHLPISDNDIAEEVVAEGRPAAPGEVLRAGYRGVAGDYFRSLGIPLVAGRTLDEQDRRSGRAVAVVNESLARRLWPDGDAVGRRIGLEGMMPRTEGFGVVADHEVVGVVGDVRHRDLSTAPQGEVFVPYPRMPWSVFFVTLRVDGDPLAVAGDARRAVWAEDPELPVADLATMEERLAAKSSRPRFQGWLIGTFAAAACLLAAAGVYALVAFAFSERTHEIGLRMALGARRQRLVRWLVGRGLRPVAAGLAAGAVAALLLMRLLGSFVDGVEPLAPLPFAAVAAVLAATAALACWLPARRATRIDPTLALRKN